MSEKRDYYEVLEVSRTASHAEIKKGYRTKAKKFHPDISKEPNAEVHFKEVNEAYEVLSNEDSRSAYDRFGHAGVNGNNGHGDPFGGFGAQGSPFGDIFETFFGGGMGGAQSRTRAPQRGADIQVTINLTFEAAVFGAEKEIEIDRLETCETCHGSRMKDGATPSTCSTCSGTGEVRSVQQTILGQFMTSGPCTTCHGEGVIISDPCSTCRGKGRVRKYTKLMVAVPGGIDDGQTIRMTGQGEAAPGQGMSGDLFVKVRVQSHKFFERRNRQIHSTVGINVAQAALGDDIEIDTLDGPVVFTIPSGTQSGQQFRMRGKGVPDLRGGDRGDQLVTVEVIIPKKLSKEQEQLFEQLSGSLGKDVTPQPKGKGFFDRVKDAMGV